MNSTVNVSRSFRKCQEPITSIRSRLRSAQTVSVAWVSALVAFLTFPSPVAAVELSPSQMEGPRLVGGVPSGRFSNRTLSVGIEIDRERIRLVAFTVKARPFVGLLTLPDAQPIQEGKRAQVEVVLLGNLGARYTQRLDVGGLCLFHGPDAKPHIDGDTIRLHRDTFIVEVPEVEGFDRIEVAFRESVKGATSRRSLGVEQLAHDRFVAAGSKLSFSDLAIADASEPIRATTVTYGQVHWPEEFGDSDIYDLHGNLSEVGKRINVVIIPDGYTYSEKALLQSNAADLISFLRDKTPLKEHDPFFNYTVVYAYSNESGTDQCDCSIIKDTAMASGFPQYGYPCGDNGNRCLYYGWGCDVDSSANIVAAELRAPATDAGIVMVNTARYGGCGGARAVYAAGNASAMEIAVHELGHSLGGLADEYGGPGCGASADEINTSLDGINGAWPEWVPELGSPRVGARYFDECVYRAEDTCEMRVLGPPFCRVCDQHLALRYFAHPRVAPTAPVDVTSPSSPISVDLDLPVDFSVSTRFGMGPSVTNAINWKVQGPHDPAPVTVATDQATYQHVFQETGNHSVTCEVVADTNFIKPQRYASNRDIATWDVTGVVLPPPGEVSAPSSEQPLKLPSKDMLVWQTAAASGSSRFNLYRGTVSDLSTGNYGQCLQQRLLTNGTQDASAPPSGTCWTYLVTGRTSGGEGPLGNNHLGTPRNNMSPCSGMAPDMVVSSLTHVPTNPDSNDLVTSTAVVKNVGNASVGPTTLLFLIGNETPSDPGTSYAVPALGPGATASFTRQKTMGSGAYQNAATADYGNAVVESSETNNTAIDAYNVISAGIVFDSATASGDLFPAPGNLTVAYSHSVGAGLPGGLLLVFVNGKQGPGASLTNCRAASVTYRGTALASAGVASVVDGSDFKTVVEAWYLVAPAPGAGTVQMTFPGACAAIQSEALALGNVDPSAPIRAIASSTIAASQVCSVATPIASTEGGWLVDAFSYNRNLDAATQFADQIERAYNHSSVGGMESSTRASSTTMGWSLGSATCSRAVHLVVAIGPS